MISTLLYRARKPASVAQACTGSTLRRHVPTTQFQGPIPHAVLGDEGATVKARSTVAPPIAEAKKGRDSQNTDGTRLARATHRKYGLVSLFTIRMQTTFSDTRLTSATHPQSGT